MTSLLSHQWLRHNSCTWHMMNKVAAVHHAPKVWFAIIVIVVAGRAHCFHDCINLVPRAILKNSSLSSYSEKMCWGRRFITTAQSVNLFIQMLLVVNQCKLRYNSKIQYLIRFVFDCAVAVNFRSKIQINRIFDIWIKYLLQFAFNHFMYLFYFYR